MTDRLGGLYPDSPSHDAFARLRVSPPQTIFEVSHQYDLNPLTMDQIVTGATPTLTLSSPVAVLAVGATTNDMLVHQSHKYLLYQPGKSHSVSITGVLAGTNALSGMGYGDDNDGIFLERDSSGVWFNFRSSTISGQRVHQSDWVIDKFDGNGPSQIVLDPSKAQQVCIDMQWLAVGRIRVGFHIDGRLYYAHAFTFANIATTAYTRTASLPVRWFIKSTGSSASMQAICATVISEGGHDPIGQLRSSSRTTSKAVGASAVRIPILSIRPSLLHGALTNRGHIVPMTYGGLADQQVLFELIQSPTLTGASFAAVGANSFTDADTSATSLTMGAKSSVVASQFAGGDVFAPTVYGTFDTRIIAASLDAAGSSPDIITLAASGLGSLSAAVYGSLSWVEVR